MRLLVVDASVIGSNLLPDEAAHAASARFLELARNRGQTVILPLILLPEIGAILGRRLNRPDLTAPLLRHLLATESFRLASFDEPQAFEAADLAAHARLRAADSIYAALARRLGATLVTLDREQRLRSEMQVDVATPEEMIQRWQEASGNEDVGKESDHNPDHAEA